MVEKVLIKKNSRFSILKLVIKLIKELKERENEKSFIRSDIGQETENSSSEKTKGNIKSPMKKSFLLIFPNNLLLIKKMSKTACVLLT